MLFTFSLGFNLTQTILNIIIQTSKYTVTQLLIYNVLHCQDHLTQHSYFTKL